MKLCVTITSYTEFHKDHTELHGDFFLYLRNMHLLKHCTKIIVSLIIVIISANNGLSQVNIISTQAYDSILAKKQQEALAMLDKEDTVSTSAYWPNIKPSLFFSNVRNNITYPAKINQGHSTNFCGYAAMTHLLLKYNPAIYLHHVISLYRTGKTSLEKKRLSLSLAVRNTAGTLKNKAELDILDADQLWFLTLADQFKGYMNVLDHKYNPGDENKMWAGTNLAKFNRMLKDFTKDTLNYGWLRFHPAFKK